MVIGQTCNIMRHNFMVMVVHAHYHNIAKDTNSPEFNDFFVNSGEKVDAKAVQKFKKSVEKARKRNEKRLEKQQSQLYNGEPFRMDKLTPTGNIAEEDIGEQDLAQINAITLTEKQSAMIEEEAEAEGIWAEEEAIEQKTNKKFMSEYNNQNIFKDFGEYLKIKWKTFFYGDDVPVCLDGKTAAFPSNARLYFLNFIHKPEQNEKYGIIADDMVSDNTKTDVSVLTDTKSGEL